MDQGRKHAHDARTWGRRRSDETRALLAGTVGLRSAMLGVTAGPSLFSLSLVRPGVRGGKSSTGTVILTESAPAGGAVIALSSSGGQCALSARVPVWRASGGTERRLPRSSALGLQFANPLLIVAVDGAMAFDGIRPRSMVPRPTA